MLTIKDAIEIIKDISLCPENINNHGFILTNRYSNIYELELTNTHKLHYNYISKSCSLVKISTNLEVLSLQRMYNLDSIPEPEYGWVNVLSVLDSGNAAAVIISSKDTNKFVYSYESEFDPSCVFDITAFDEGAYFQISTAIPAPAFEKIIKLQNMFKEAQELCICTGMELMFELEYTLEKEI